VSTRSLRTIERPLRLASGLVLFAYVSSHFLNHAFGMRSINAMQAGTTVLLVPWQTTIGLSVLYTALFMHGFLGLYALYRRRHLRIPPNEAWQLALGLTIPLLLVPHAGSIRIGHSAYGLEFGYARILYQFFVLSPDIALPRQYLMLLVVWIHGCIGLRFWLRSKAWYPRAVAALAATAILVPILALIGITNAGLDIRQLAEHDPAVALRYAVAAPSTSAEHLGRASDMLWASYIALVLATLSLRVLRARHERMFGGIRVTYPGPRVVTIPAGFSILEASRWAKIPHASVCGGRGRCSTCRVRVTAGAERLPAPSQMEQDTLLRIAAGRDVRLACQLRPVADIAIEPLVSTPQTVGTHPARFAAAIEGGQELEVAALFVDLRESTRLATDLLPYDALFLLDRYIQVVTGAVRDNGGHVTSIAGDGVMTLFGLQGNSADAARSAFMATLQLWAGVESLNRELAHNLRCPLRIGVGLHVGVAIVGVLSAAAGSALQFLGDTGNIAAKLETETKRQGCTLIASYEAAYKVAHQLSDFELAPVMIPGKDHSMPAVLFRRHDDLKRLLARA
jgi:adenylate cyclase